MKRPARLTRRTPLTRTPIRVTAEQVQRWCDTQRAARRRAADKPRTPLTRTRAETTARQLVLARSHGWCEIDLPGCRGGGHHFHHRVRRSQGGPWTASNGLRACWACHGAVTNTRGRRDEYRGNGWVLDSTQDPARTPVRHTRLGWVLFDNNGGWTPHPTTTEDAA